MSEEGLELSDLVARHSSGGELDPKALLAKRRGSLRQGCFSRRAARATAIRL